MPKRIPMKRVLPKTLKYEVSQADIDESTSSCDDCPHARAIKRKTGSLKVRVFGGRVSVVGKDGHIYYYSAPTGTHKFEVARDTAGIESCSPGTAVLTSIGPPKKRRPPGKEAEYNRNRADPEKHKEQTLASHRRISQALRAKGLPARHYRTRTGTVEGVVS